MATWEEVRVEAELVLSLAKDEQYVGGQKLADMVLSLLPAVEEVEARQVLIVHQPNDHGTWSVVGDLREIVDLDDDSTNYIVCDKLIAEGWPRKNMDPEYSCFYGYTATQDEALRLFNDAIVLAERLRDER